MTQNAPHRRPSGRSASPASRLEPRIAEILDARLDRRQRGTYVPLTADDVAARLAELLAGNSDAGARVTDVARMPGGASKEQFSFLVHRLDGTAERLVLRADPTGSIIETDRAREAEALRAVRTAVPVPEVRYLDPDGALLGTPAAVTTFVPGVARPTSGGAAGVTGVGNTYGRFTDGLADQFVGHLADIHALDWREAELPSFGVPQERSRQAASWQLEWWARVWREDQVEAVPLLDVAEQWLRENVPTDDGVVLVHGDYRMGNFLFDEATGRITAVLDWELCHLGDHHEDLGWMIQRLYRSPGPDGRLLVCGLLPEDQLLETYEQRSGRTVDPATLRWYLVLSYYKCAVMNLSSGPLAARLGHSHQDVLLSWLATVGHTFVHDIAAVLAEELAA